MTTRDIQEIVNDLYRVDVSATLVSETTADLDAQVAVWRNRQLDAMWPIVYFDGIVVHVRGGNGRVSPQTMYVALGVNMQGYKELLGLWLNETEGAKFWLSCLEAVMHFLTPRLRAGERRRLANAILRALQSFARNREPIVKSVPASRRFAPQPNVAVRAHTLFWLPYVSPL
jgi:hypothetical protein